MWVLIEKYVMSSYWKWKNLSLNSGTFFFNKYDGISLEISWALKFKIWRVSVSIKCNFLRYLNQVSYRNKQPLPFLNFLTWYKVLFLFLLISLYGYLQYTSARTSWSLIYEFYWNRHLICKFHAFAPSAKWPHFLSPFVKGYHWT